MGNFQGRELRKTWASFLVTREAVPISVRVRPVSVYMTLSKSLVVSQVRFEYIFSDEEVVVYDTQDIEFRSDDHFDA